MMFAGVNAQSLKSPDGSSKWISVETGRTLLQS
jgi:hypothetical protein